jgi:type VI secretion system protein ImpH
MARGNRQPATSLIDSLFAAPHAFRFFQAVRLLELARNNADPGSSVSPSLDPVRFRVLPSGSLPNSEITSLQAENDKPPEMTVAFMGLTGPTGVLPDHYTALVVERSHQQNKDNALREFFDLFNHRAITLFYLAWRKHRVAEEFDRQQRNPDKSANNSADKFSEMLYAIAGIGTPNLKNRLSFRDHIAVFYGGLFALRTRSAAGLEAMLRHFLQLPVRVQQFQTRWLNLPVHTQSSLSSPQVPQGRNLRLGLETVLGTRVRDSQSCFRIVVGPLQRPQFESLLPGNIILSRIIDLIRLYAGPELDFEIQLLLLRSHVLPVKFTPQNQSSRSLGWTSWLGNSKLPTDADDVVFRFSGLPDHG